MNTANYYWVDKYSDEPKYLCNFDDDDVGEEGSYCWELLIDWNYDDCILLLFIWLKDLGGYFKGMFDWVKLKFITLLTIAYYFNLSI